MESMNIGSTQETMEESPEKTLQFIAEQGMHVLKSASLASLVLEKAKKQGSNVDFSVMEEALKKFRPGGEYHGMLQEIANTTSNLYWCFDGQRGAPDTKLILVNEENEDYEVVEEKIKTRVGEMENIYKNRVEETRRKNKEQDRIKNTKKE